jgi:hypothetical protein
MNKVLTLIIALAASMACFSQTYSYQPIVDTTLAWHTLNIIYPLGMETDINSVYTISSKDSMVGVHSYRAISGPSFDAGNYIREDSTKKVYLYNGSDEFIIYDFAANPGDTIRERANDTSYYVVSNVDTINVNNQQRRRLSVISNIYGSVVWIEGIGDSELGLKSHHTNQMGIYYFCGLTQNGRIIYTPNNTSAKCQITGIDEKIDDPRITVYPIPASENIVISLPSDIHPHAYQIYNLTGQPEISAPYSQTISVKHLSQGVYMLYITDDNGTRYYRKIVKQ